MVFSSISHQKPRTEVRAARFTAVLWHVPGIQWQMTPHLFISIGFGGAFFTFAETLLHIKSTSTTSPHAPSLNEEISRFNNH